MRHFAKAFAISQFSRYGGPQLPPTQSPAAGAMLAWGCTTYLCGDGIFFSGVLFLVLSLLSLLAKFAVGQLDAAEASVAREGSWIEALLPLCCCCWWCGGEATVELDEGRDISWPMDGSLSSRLGGDVLKAGRSKTCRIDGLRKESSTWGRGRIAVASAEAVVKY